MQRWSPKQSHYVHCALQIPKRCTGQNGQSRYFQTSKRLERRPDRRRSKTQPSDHVTDRFGKYVQGRFSDTDQRRRTRTSTPTTDLQLSEASASSTRLQLGDGGGQSHFRITTFPIDLLQSVLNDLRQDLEEPDKIQDAVTRQCFDIDPYLRSWAKFVDAMVAIVKSGKDTPTLNNLLSVFKSSGRSGILQTIRRMYVDYLAQRRHTKDELVAQGKLADLSYPTEWFPRTRAIQRHIHLHIGPTNSGKTYQALKRLESARTGFYAGPLRLLAHEVYSRFNEKGLHCGLVTGDEIKDIEDEPPLTSHTIEMAPIHKEVDVAVVDEIQMMGDSDRGWAWTNAVLGSQAKELHLCGEARTLPLLQGLVASMGDTLHVHKYERLNPLKAMNHSLHGNLRNLEKGDCLVLFTVIGLHAMKKEIELRTGRRCAIVYGSLPPEIRAQQAQLFNEPDNDFDFLVASDAIGMGLNLSIKRIIFESTWKSDGRRFTQLSISSLKQIAGRAGRYRVAGQKVDSSKSTTGENESSENVGLVTSLTDADLPFIQQALASDPQPITKAGLLPPTEILERFCRYYPKDTSFRYLLRRLHKLAIVSPAYFLCGIDEQCSIAACVDGLAGLSIADRYTLCASPVNVDPRKPYHVPVLQALARSIAAQECDLLSLTEMDFEALDSPVSGDRKYLERLEKLHKALILYLWLSYRFTGIFIHQPLAFHTKKLVEEKIDQAILEFSANRRLREELLKRKQAVVEQLAAEATEKERKEREEPIMLEETNRLPPDHQDGVSDAANELNTPHGINSSASEKGDTDIKSTSEDGYNDEELGLSDNDDVEAEEHICGDEALNLRHRLDPMIEAEKASETDAEEAGAKNHLFQELHQQKAEDGQFSSSENDSTNLSSRINEPNEEWPSSELPVATAVMDPSAPDLGGPEMKPITDGFQIQADSTKPLNIEETLDDSNATAIKEGQDLGQSTRHAISPDNSKEIIPTGTENSHRVEDRRSLSLYKSWHRFVATKAELEARRDRLVEMLQSLNSEDPEQGGANLEAMSVDLSQTKETLEQLSAQMEDLATKVPGVRELSRVGLRRFVYKNSDVLRDASKVLDSAMPP